MAKYIVKRILFGILSLFVLVGITFFLTRAIPGSPFQSANVSGDVLEMMETEYKLNEPVWVQYGNYMKNLLRGDLGYSYQNPGKSVTEIIAGALPATLEIGIPAIILTVTVVIMLGVMQATVRSRGIKHLIFAGTMLGTGIPGFVAGLVLVFVFGVWLKVLPVAGLSTWRHHILPTAALALYPVSVVTRLTQNLFGEECQKEYVMMAKAKGLKWRRIIVGHVLRHVWIPILNYMSSACAFFLTGSFVIESIFTIPGLGRQFVSSIANRDYTLIMGLTIFMGSVVIVLNLMIDILSACIDPRIRHSLYLHK